jgi:uncharacterized protein
MPDEATEPSQAELNHDEPHGRFFLLAISATAFAGCIIVAFVGQFITGASATAAISESDLEHPSTWVAAVLVALPMFALLYLERGSRFAWLRELWELSSELLGPVVVRVTFAELVVVSLFAGIGEELLFRGFLQSWLGTYGLLVALVVPNLMFGALHWISRGYAACTFCIGLYFSCLLHFADSVNLATLMVAHSLYDLVALMCLAREVRSRADRVSC